MFHTTYHSLLILSLIPLSAAELHHWFITTDNPATTQTRSESWDYLGAYHSRRLHYVYRQRGDAATDSRLRGFEEVTVQSKTEDTAYIWVEASPIAPVLEREQPCFLESLVALIDSPLSRIHDHPIGQTPMGNSRPSIDLIWSSHDAAILSIPRFILPNLDMYLPRFFEPVLIPEEPLPLPLEHKEDPRIEEILANLRFDADVASILSALSLAQMVDDVRWLTGEASNIISRHSFSDGSRVAANWLKKQFEGTGAVCDLQTFLEGFAPNVRCLYESEKDNNTTVIFGAHYDSRGSFGRWVGFALNEMELIESSSNSTRAPGGDDDGSGISSLLAIAKATERKSVKFGVNVELVAFAGEEQGLLGSRAYASQSASHSALSEVSSRCSGTSQEIRGYPPHDPK